jgi:hemerythrin superfamily protein
MAATERDVISVLTRDHAQVQELFGRLQPARDPGERRRLADEVTIMLVGHAVAEERYLFPVLRKVLPGGDTITSEAIADHAAIEKALKQLYETDPAGPEFDAVLSKLLVHVHSHINGEEEVLFPRLADHFTDDALIELGDRVQSAKDKAPTRPHPAVAGTPPLNKLLAPGTGLAERIRDRLCGNGPY